ncbi:hypothetical protein [Pseudochryseolinea flava]|uniref:Beta-galactosidase trimerisation domain-containing protein n=1 Tax=Pseudochryseolinea flava TaxID=2059302 RepID=A0A364Y5E2_9BACT|nr:hypothetical protein [Pseudochryseolinea flava]RAW02173.1 hypothetical protein DQQ10_06410 [Pseudochryseolinea flava]
MQKLCIAMLTLLCCEALAQQKVEKAKNVAAEKTTFQTAGPWKPVTDVRADVAIVYGVEDRGTMTFEQRVKSWRDRGYTTHFMTGIAWGGYQDYFTGKWDGKMHLDEGQVTQKGDTLWHGHMVPYIVPSMNFIAYMKEKIIKRVIDAGIDAIYLEEPEFWARAGYSEAFKREWNSYYGFDWRPQHESAENTYLSSKLKYHLYYRALNECFTFAKTYGKSKGMNIRCYVPTHSLVNYAQWMIVSPEASLASLPCVDGYIAQVWTGTSREPNYFDGNKKERVFETAFLEYGSMESMTAPTGRKMFFLTDPIEDWPRDWADYKRNYQATFTAQLLYPMIADYEVMPWPDRIYEGLYRTRANDEKKERIPRFYSTQMQVMVNALNTMPRSENKVSGAHGIGVLMSNTLMFQRFPTHQGYDDPQLSNFYGQAFPFIKRGVPVKTVHIENVSFQNTLKDVKVLVMSYSNMKPMDKLAHDFLAAWVKKGGVLVYCGKDDDAFQRVQEWWNTGEEKFNAPSEHLFLKLGVKAPFSEGEYKIGAGKVCIIRSDPKEFVLAQNRDHAYINTVKKLYEEQGGVLTFKNHFTLTRGPYEIISVVDENPDQSTYTLDGKLIDLFDPEIPVLDTKKVNPGEQAFLYNIGRIENVKTPQVLVSASRVYEEKVSKNTYAFVVKSPRNTLNVMRVYMPAKPNKIEVVNGHGNMIDTKTSWDAASKTCFLSFENDPDGVTVKLTW